MAIHESNDFEILDTGISGEGVPTCNLLNKASGKNIVVTGCVLEKQLDTSVGHLLFLTENNPYEEALHIHLLSKDLILLDSVEIAANYRSGLFRNFKITQPNGLQFSFLDDAETWQFELLDRPQFNFLRLKYPAKRSIGNFWDKGLIRIRVSG